MSNALIIYCGMVFSFLMGMYAHRALTEEDKKPYKPEHNRPLSLHPSTMPRIGHSGHVRIIRDEGEGELDGE